MVGVIPPNRDIRGAFGGNILKSFIRAQFQKQAYNLRSTLMRGIMKYGVAGFIPGINSSA